MQKEQIDEREARMVNWLEARDDGRPWTAFRGLSVQARRRCTCTGVAAFTLLSRRTLLLCGAERASRGDGLGEEK